MFAYRTSEQSDVTDELDNTTPLPELTLYDLLDPPTTSKEQQLHPADNDISDDDDADEDDDDEGGNEDFLSSSLNDSLNTPKPKKPPIVRILENKRISGPAPIGTALKNMLGGPIRIVTTPTKPTQATEVKILNKVQAQPFKAFGNTAIKIGSTTIATPTGSGTAATSKNIGGVTMTQIKTADGKVLFLQKSMPVTAGATSKVPVNTSSARVVTQPTASGIRQTILPKGVTITGAGLLKSSAPIAVRGLTTIGPAKSSISSSAAAVTTTTQSTPAPSTPAATVAAVAPVTNKVPIKVVRTADGKLIKLNQGASPVLLNAKAGTTVALRAAGSTGTTITTSTLSNNNSGNSGNVVISKPTAQVIIKGPLKQLPAGASIRPVISNISSSTTTTTTTGNSSSGSSSSNIVTTTAAAATQTLPAGKMLVQSSTGKQIVVASKNIIKLSPKPAASGSTSTTTAATATPPGLHAIQLPGKSGVQYVRVLSNNSSSATNTTTGSNNTTSSPQKVPLGRPRTISSNNNTTTTPGNSSTRSSTGAVGNTSKIVMKTTVALSGGSIVPLPSMQTLVPRRAPVAAPGSATKTLVKSSSNISSLEAGRKHRLSDLNVQLKQLTSDGSSSSDPVGPDAKKARYVIAMPQASATSAGSTTTGTSPGSQQQMPKLTPMRSMPVQRVSVQGASSSSSNNNNSGNATNRKVYNLVTKSDANGVRYMICNKGGEGKPRTVFNTTMRRGYTLADTKVRRPTTLTPQQLRFKQIKMLQQRQVLAQAQAKQRQPPQPIQSKPQQSSSQSKALQQQQQQSSSTQANKATVPGKQQFDILRPPPTPAPAASTAIDALGGTRRKHCNCSKSQCLKLYCDCFANGEFCQDCTCKDCFNNLDYEVKRERAIRSCLERNPSAFKPKITAPNSGDMRLHNKGCNCKRSGCLKNYCECYEAKIPCSGMCKCVGCRNMEDRPDVDMDSMDSLADVKQRTSKIKEQNGTLPQDNRSNVYLTDDVIEATIMCMISRIVMQEKHNLPIEDTERVVMEELGESLNQIITFAKDKNDTIQTDDPKTTA